MFFSIVIIQLRVRNRGEDWFMSLGGLSMYFAVCGGGAPANKISRESLPLVSSEEHVFRQSIQASADALFLAFFRVISRFQPTNNNQNFTFQIAQASPCKGSDDSGLQAYQFKGKVILMFHSDYSLLCEFGRYCSTSSRRRDISSYSRISSSLRYQSLQNPHVCKNDPLFAPLLN